MLNQVFKISLILMLFSIGCKKEENISVKASSFSDRKQELNDTVVKRLNNKDFSLKIVSYVVNDTLDIDDYKKNRYSNPIILGQDLSFFKGELLIKQYKLPIKKVKVKTITKASVNIMETPIYKVCLVKNSDEEFYIVKGAFYDYCNGANCPEFIGIYSMKGKALYEGYTNEKSKVSLKDVLSENKIQLNKSTNCEKIDDFYKY